MKEHFTPSNSQASFSADDELNVVVQYVAEAGEASLLTEEQELLLGMQINAGRSAQQELNDFRKDESYGIPPHLESLINTAQQAQNALIKANTRLVLNRAKIWKNILPVPYEDIIQEGNLGLIRAAGKFDYTIGRFSTVAIQWIDQAIRKSVEYYSDPVDIKLNTRRDLVQLYNAQQLLALSGNVNPTSQDLAVQTGFSLKRIKDLQRINPIPVSINRPVGSGNQELGDVIKSEAGYNPESELFNEDLIDKTYEVLEALTAREQRILELRYGLNGRTEHNNVQIGVLFGISRERVRQILEEALAKLREPHRQNKIIDYYTQ